MRWLYPLNWLGLAIWHLDKTKLWIVEFLSSFVSIVDPLALASREHSTSTREQRAEVSRELARESLATDTER